MIEAKVDDGDLRRLARETTRAAERSTAVGAHTAAAALAIHARSAVPKRTGRLAASIAVRTMADGAEVEMNTVYAGWIEYGGTRGRPYVSQGRYLGSGIPAADALFARSTDAAMSAQASGI
jgi:phage gpG-like protein